MNPVRAGLVDRPQDYAWSSASAHIKKRDDRLVRVAPLLALAGRWRRFPGQAVDVEAVERLRRHERTARPLGTDRFVAKLQKRLGRRLRARRTGRKPKQGSTQQHPQ